MSILFIILVPIDVPLPVFAMGLIFFLAYDAILLTSAVKSILEDK